MKSLTNKPAININYEANTARIYRDGNQYFTYIVSRTEIRPYSSKKMKDIADYLINNIGFIPSGVDLSFIYPNTFSNSKKLSIQQLIKNKAFDRDILMRFITLL